MTNAFNGYVNYDLPFGHGRTFGKDANKLVNAVLGDWRTTRFYGAWRTADFDDPFGSDPDGAYFQPRPDCLSPSEATPYKNFVGGGYVWFNPLTMAIPGPGNSATARSQASAARESSRSI